MLNREEMGKRIANTNEAGLVVILYEALIDNFQDSIKAIKEKNYKELNYINNNSRDILSELIVTLQGDSQIAIDLKSIYLFANKLITNGENNRDEYSYKKAIEIITPLCEGFMELEKIEDPKVITGIVYGKGNLKSYTIEENKTFKG